MQDADVIAAHAAELELTQDYLDQPRFDFVFNMKVWLPRSDVVLGWRH